MENLSMARNNTVPFVTCICGKRGFEDEYDAEKALGKARTKRERSADKAGSRRGMYRENRTYYCSQGDVFHLTEQSRRTFASYSMPELAAA
jgi:hypothetical protein